MRRRLRRNESTDDLKLVVAGSRGESELDLAAGRPYLDDPKVRSILINEVLRLLEKNRSNEVVIYQDGEAIDWLRSDPYDLQTHRGVIDFGRDLCDIIDEIEPPRRSGIRQGWYAPNRRVTHRGVEGDVHREESGFAGAWQPWSWTSGGRHSEEFYPTHRGAEADFRRHVSRRRLR